MFSGDAFKANHYMTEALTPSGFVSTGPAGGLLVFFYVYLFFLVVRKPFEYMASVCCKG
jgi:hypothetical protein